MFLDEVIPCWKRGEFVAVIGKQTHDVIICPVLPDVKQTQQKDRGGRGSQTLVILPVLTEKIEKLLVQKGVYLQEWYDSCIIYKWGGRNEAVDLVWDKEVHWLGFARP